MPADNAQLRKILRSPIPAFIIREITEALPAIVFFAVGFNLIVLTTQLILDDYEAQFAGFMVATAAALLVGKAVLVAKLLPFFRLVDNAPVIQPILFQTFVYWAVVVLARVLEKLRVLARWRTDRRHSGIYDDAFHLASFCRDPDLDLRSVLDLHHGRRLERVVRSW